MIHYSFIGYMLASAIIMTVSVIAYRLLMESRVRPSANRFILLFIYAISFIVPLLTDLFPESQNEATIEIGKLQYLGAVGKDTANLSTLQIGVPDIIYWITTIYFIGVSLSFLFSLFTLCHLIFLLRKSGIMEIAGQKVNVHDNKKLSSFSWCNKIFLYKDVLNSEMRDLQMLVRHEKAHLDKRHWMDLALAQIILIFQWFNPAAWFMRRELQRIHEYEADETVLRSGINEKDYQMLLIQNISGSRYSGLTDGLNNCSLKKRIIMMKKTKFKKDWVTRGIAVCGFAILGGLIIHIPAVAEVLTEPTKPVVNSEKLIVIKGESDTNSATPDASYFINGEKAGKDKLTSIEPSNIMEIKIDKSSDVPKVELTTKTSPGENEDKKDFSDLKERIEKTDFNAHKKKGELDNYPEAYGVTDKLAEYKGGQAQLVHDLSYLINYPEEAKKEGIQGRVVVRFQINPDGSVSNCEVLRGINPLLDEEAVRVIEQTSGNWIAGEVDDKPVASIFNLPVTFKLSGEESK